MSEERRKEMITFCYDMALKLEDEIIVCFEDVSDAELQGMYSIYKQGRRLGWIW